MGPSRLDNLSATDEMGGLCRDLVQFLRKFTLQEGEVAEAGVSGKEPRNCRSLMSR